MTFSPLNFKLTIIVAFSVGSLALGQVKIVDDRSNAFLPDQKFDHFVKLGFRFYGVNDSLALISFEGAVVAAEDLGDSLKITQAKKYLGQTLRSLGNLQSSLTVLENALLIASNNRFVHEEAKILRAISLTETFLADYVNAYEHSLKALRLFRNLNGEAETGDVLINIGFILYKMENYSGANSYNFEALRLFGEKETDCRVQTIKGNIALCYAFMGNLKLAEVYLKEAFGPQLTACSEMVLHGKFDSGVVSYIKNDVQSARDNFENSYREAKEANNPRMACDNLLYLGRIALRDESYRAAERYFIECWRVASRSGYHLLVMDSFYELSKLYRETNRLAQASLFQEKYLQVRDSIMNVAVTNRVMSIQMEYVQEKNEAFNKNNLTLIEAYQSRYAYISALTLLLIGMLITVSVRLRKKQSINHQLRIKVKERTDELITNVTTLKRMIREQSLFFEKAVGDIKEPIISITGIANVASVDLQSEIAREYIHQTKNATDHLTKTVARLSDISRLSKLDLGYDDIDLVSLVSGVVAKYGSRHPELDLTVKNLTTQPTKLHSRRHAIEFLVEILVDEAGSLKKKIVVEVSDTLNQLLAVSIRFLKAELNVNEIDLSMARYLGSYAQAQIVCEERETEIFIIVILRELQWPSG